MREGRSGPIPVFPENNIQASTRGLTRYFSIAIAPIVKHRIFGATGRAVGRGSEGSC